MASEDQQAILARVKGASPQKRFFIKDAPILGYRLASDKLEDIPEAIRKHLGSVDNTQYTAEHLRANIASVIALQMNGDKPDFYLIGKETLAAKYKIVPASEAGVKNAKLLKGLLGVEGLAPLLQPGEERVVGALKIAPVEMIRMSDLGYPIEHAVTIKSPWGEQTKPAGSDAYMVWDASQNQYYMVNVDAAGLPISYIAR